MLNFLASMGWNDGTEQKFSRTTSYCQFSLDRVQRSGARFDEKRLLLDERPVDQAARTRRPVPTGRQYPGKQRRDIRRVI